MRVTEIETLEVVKVSGAKATGIIPGINFMIRAVPGKIEIKQTPGGYLVKVGTQAEMTFIPMTNVKRAYVVDDEPVPAQQGKGKAA